MRGTSAFTPNGNKATTTRFGHTASHMGNTGSREAAAISRREFLAASLAAWAASGMAQCAASEGRPVQPGVQLGFSLYGMKGVPLEEALQLCAQTGYRQVELALNPGYASHPGQFSLEARRSFVERLRALGLSVPCLMLNLSLTAEAQAHAEGLQAIAEAAALARDLDPVNPPFLETVLGGKPAFWEDQKRGMVEKLGAWVEAAQKSRTRLALKAHVNSAVNSPERLLWLLDELKSEHLCVAYDYSHFEIQGMDLERTLEALLPQTRFIHVKDSSGDAAKFQFLLPGEGRTDYVRYFSLLKRMRYSGPVCVEVSGMIFNKPGYDPGAAAKRSYDVLSRALASAA
ncbi:MAG: sugar phosphate isomerase/epimerase [Verrucomicrobia bacterium]|nr:sugar phosphate isomerase/epimerase [Verrucomicrobiota bacterium]